VERFRSRVGVNVYFSFLSITAPVQTIVLFAQCAQFFPPHPVIASFSSTDESEKRVRTSAVKLLVCRRLRGRESHYRQKLCKELCAEMPPRVPEKILRRRSETANRRTFQIRMELVDYDERLCSFSALLNDPQRIATVEQHCSHHGDVEFSVGRTQIVSVAVVHLGFGLQGGVTELVGILQLLHHDSTRTEHFVQSCIRIRDKVPAVLVCSFDRDHVGAALF
jgi:hypothetical protein